MTRIIPASGASLAHFSARQRWQQENREQKTEQTSSSQSRHYGNRRMGDRRTDERRTHGRRSADRNSAHTARPWISAELSAHLIGQTSETEISRDDALSAYAAVNRPVKTRRGGVI
ncbi:hypothetical protein [Ponticaulis sp.]|uniref:hypothetical protein n=1 Tax=Ponticaulis sp. TaxID=2020902 RepID=UPI000B71748E|nr:hypothetical protein [Ponticaulis sp.]MAI91340.1 hypothetical protein [Ponticaulis sp.]OUX97939.1 MAG: hypothetical protein CBB65_12930 [Hyphomonadaceae bacterium TMED5]|tara:strand:+ start:34878 stop:35225 length:348 start_codon:yes stop_codon:yes gene_type:complete